MDIQYRFFENPDCEALAKALIQPLQWLLPPWLHELHIVSAVPEDDEGSTNCTRVKHEYGLATIEIYPLFWEQPPGKQEMLILHEILHVVHGRVHSLVHRRLLSHLKEANLDLYTFAEDEFRERTEEFVENLAQAISGRSVPPRQH